MTDLERSVERIRPRLQPRWTPARADAAEQGLLARQRRRARLRRGAGALLVLLLPLGALGVWLRLGRAPGEAPASLSAPLDVVRFSDGSVAYLLGEGSVLAEAPAAPGARAVIRLSRGAARFAVRHDPRRPFVVEAGPVRVEVIGTRFTIARAGPRVEVAVEEGRVRVHHGGGSVELGAGERAAFADPAPAPAAAAVPGPEAPGEERPPGAGRGGDRARRASSPSTAPSPAPSTPPPATWQDLVQEGDYDRAYAALAAAAAPPQGPAELLLAADVARLSHHPLEAVAPLRRLLDDRPGDSRAPLCAFTLGRVLLDELGRPREAAEAFARAQELAPLGPLCQDALAREVESWARAGDPVRARQLAERYLARYPDGRRVRAVRRHGGLE